MIGGRASAGDVRFRGEHQRVASWQRPPRGSSPSEANELELLLGEQAAYYRAVAAEYGDHALPCAGGDELSEALDAFQPAGDVLELACGPGTWTGHLLAHAQNVTAVDASAEMLAITSARFDDERVRFAQADVFGWKPDRRYDVVFFGFWLSHVPYERFESFWSLVAGCLKPAGRVFFADDGYRTLDELVEGESSSVIRRKLNDGTHYRAVKVPLRPADLEQRLARMGWDVTVTPTSGPFFWGGRQPWPTVIPPRRVRYRMTVAAFVDTVWDWSTASQCRNGGM